MLTSVSTANMKRSQKLHLPHGILYKTAFQNQRKTTFQKAKMLTFIGYCYTLGSVLNILHITDLSLMIIHENSFIDEERFVWRD